MLASTTAALAADPSGGFYVHLNQQNTTGFSDSRRSVTFYDGDDLIAGSASPLFSVHIPGEQRAVGAYNGEELDAIATDPATGDVYVLAFDSGTVGNVDTGTGDAPNDTEGDLDIYRINFAAAYDHWSANFQGTTVTAGVTTGVGGVAPTIPAGAPAGGFNDYITYGSQTQYGSGLHFDDVNRSHSNTFNLPGVVEKIAEVKRNDGQGFYDYSLEFIDSDTLLLLDDSSIDDNNESAATDHAYRLIERVSTSPGSANDATADNLDGGFNLGTTESWNSRVIGRTNLDFAGGVASGHSEPESLAYHHDSASGVRGFWVTESDSSATTRGDDIAFWDLDAGAYREHAVGGGPDFPTSFALDNDPFTDSSLNDGQADHIFVDADTGDLIIVESGFGDDAIPSVGAEHEPSVIRREVLSYDNGEGRIQFGAWSEKQITTPNKDPGDTGFLERGNWAAYDSENDLVIFNNPGAAGETPSFQNDIMVLDVNTGVTTTLNNVDESVALFFTDGFGDVADFFTLPELSGLVGDYNNDGTVDAADYTVWRDGGSPDNTPAGYDAWANNYGATASSAVAVPEPAAALLAAIALSAFAIRRLG